MSVLQRELEIGYGHHLYSDSLKGSFNLVASCTRLVTVSASFAYLRRVPCLAAIQQILHANVVAFARDEVVFVVDDVASLGQCGNQSHCD